MNKIVGIDKDGMPFLMVVLEPGNLHILQTKGDPVLIRLRDYFPDAIPLNLQILIGYSETPVADAKQWAQYAQKVDDERTAVMRDQKPHCPECRSTIETVGAGHYSECTYPFYLVFCPVCGCTLGTHFDADPLAGAAGPVQ